MFRITLMTTPYLYSYTDIEQILFSGFNFTIPPETLNIISSLAVKVGSPAYVKTPVFQKREPLVHQNVAPPIRNRRNRDEVQQQQQQQSTASVLVQQEGISVHINQIRVCLNKVSESTYSDVLVQLKSILTLSLETASDDDIGKIGDVIFEIASNNKFFSRLYANLYTELLKTFPPLNVLFHKNYDSYLLLFRNIEYIDPDTDYNKFCVNNLANERRKATSLFFVNLSLNGTIAQESVDTLLREVLESVLCLMVQPNKSNEVCELVENVAILYKKQEIPVMHNGTNVSISQVVAHLSATKMKTYPSLSSKSIFKFMDIV